MSIEHARPFRPPEPDLPRHEWGTRDLIQPVPLYQFYGNVNNRQRFWFSILLERSPPGPTVGWIISPPSTSFAISTKIYVTSLTDAASHNFAPRSCRDTYLTPVSSDFPSVISTPLDEPSLALSNVVTVRPQFSVGIRFSLRLWCWAK